MKRTLLIIPFLVIGTWCYSQGVSFSYLIPKNGYLSAPVSPFSIRGVGIGGLFGIETGFSLYNIPGLAMEQLPFEYDEPLTGPHFAVLVPAEIYIKFPLGPMTIKPLAGGFAWWNINTRINEGNMDRAFREYEGWQVLNTDFELEDKIGFGWMAGLEFQFKVNDKFSIITEAQYLKGKALSELTGSYIGANDGNIETRSLDIPEAEILIEGVEISLGVQFNK